jgi:hypothetical protein
VQENYETQRVYLRKTKKFDYEVLDRETITFHVNLLLDVDSKIIVYSLVSKTRNYTSIS